jgi:hypothetical protein
MFGNYAWTWISKAESIETVAIYKILSHRRKYSTVITYSETAVQNVSAHLLHFEFLCVAVCC